MYQSRPMSPEVEKLLRVLPPDVADELRGIYRDYASLLKEAGRDRQAVLGFVDNLGARLDDLPLDPEAAGEKAARVADRAKADAVREALIDAQLAVEAGTDIRDHIEKVYVELADRRGTKG